LRLHSIISHLVFVFALSLSFACTKKEPVYTISEMFKMAKEADASFEEVFIPDTQNFRHLRVICDNYGEGCKGNGKRFKVKGVDILVIEFESESTARAEAQRINQWHARNWLFDDVTNEPILESYVTRAFKAVNPNRPEKKE